MYIKSTPVAIAMTTVAQTVVTKRHMSAVAARFCAGTISRGMSLSSNSVQTIMKLKSVT